MFCLAKLTYYATCFAGRAIPEQEPGIRSQESGVRSQNALHTLHQVKCIAFGVWVFVQSISDP